LDLRGWHLSPSENFVSSDGTIANSPSNQAGWVNLAVRQPFASNDNLGGSVKFAIDIPAVLRTNGQEWAIVFGYAGIKQVK
jgi:hypothetical protein